MNRKFSACKVQKTLSSQPTQHSRPFLIIFVVLFQSQNQKQFSNKSMYRIFISLSTLFQYVTEKMGGAEGTKLDLDFMEMERVRRR